MIFGRHVRASASASASTDPMLLSASMMWKYKCLLSHQLRSLFVNYIHMARYKVLFHYSITFKRSGKQQRRHRDVGSQCIGQCSQCGWLTYRHIQSWCLASHTTRNNSWVTQYCITQSSLIHMNRVHHAQLRFSDVSILLLLSASAVAHAPLSKMWFPANIITHMWCWHDSVTNVL